MKNSFPKATAQELMRTGRGLQFILDIVLTTKTKEVRDVGIYTLGCAVDKNGTGYIHISMPIKRVEKLALSFATAF